MKRPSEKLLKDMSNEELSAEAEWHVLQAAGIFEEVSRMRADALDADEHKADEILQSAAERQSEAEAHIHQSNLLNSLMASRLSDEGVGVVERAAKA